MPNAKDEMTKSVKMTNSNAGILGLIFSSETNDAFVLMTTFQL